MKLSFWKFIGIIFLILIAVGPGELFLFRQATINRGPYFSNFSSIEIMLEKTEGQLANLSEDQQWRAVDTLITAFNYFYDGGTITYEQILPLEKLWAEYLDGIENVAKQPISAAIAKHQIPKATPEDLKILPATTKEYLINLVHFTGDIDSLTFSVDFALKYLNDIFCIQVFLPRELSYNEMLQTTGDLKVLCFVNTFHYFPGVLENGFIPEVIFLAWFGNDTDGLKSLLNKSETSKLKFNISPHAINQLIINHQPSTSLKSGIKFIDAVCTLLNKDGRYINGRFSEEEFQILSKNINWLIEQYEPTTSTDMLMALNRLQSLVGR